MFIWVVLLLLFRNGGMFGIKKRAPTFSLHCFMVAVVCVLLPALLIYYTPTRDLCGDTYLISIASLLSSNFIIMPSSLLWILLYKLTAHLFTIKANRMNWLVFNFIKSPDGEHGRCVGGYSRGHVVVMNWINYLF